VRGFFWSSLCFVGLTLNNVLLMLDRLVFTQVDLSSVRLGITLAAVILLLCGLVLESS
jgi:hypothetical protein